MRRFLGRLLIVAAVAAVGAVLAVWAPHVAAGDDAPTDPATTTSPPALPVAPPPIVVVIKPRYHGHNAQWWQHRYAAQRRHTRKLQSALRSRLGLGARRLAGVSSSPDALLRAFLCIHRFEGSWSDPAAPYYGGVQMDLRFARSYGRAFFGAWGTPDRWPPFVQVTVAMNAYLSGRGFRPWPNTARSCGLLP